MLLQIRRWLTVRMVLGLAALSAVACNEEAIGGAFVKTPPRIAPVRPVTLAVVHDPNNPSTNTTVTISAVASDPAALASTTISVDDSVVKECTGGSCAHAVVYAPGDHSYSAAGTDTAGKPLTALAATFTVSEPWTSPGPAPQSPHWRHMRTSVIDYRIHYQKEPQKSAEYDWAAAHYDHVTGGLGLLNEYKRRNPTITHSTYDTFWFIPVASAGGTEAWLAANGYNVEDAYLHQAGTTKEKANRITAQQFAGRDYWYYNLGDPGFRTWRNQETRRQMEPNAQGYRSNTIFYDSNSPSTVRKYVPAVTLEYGSYADYFAHYHSLLAEQRSLVPAGYLIPNHAQNFNKAEEMATASIAGGVMIEYENTPFGSGVKEWNNIDRLVADGVVVQFATGVSPGSKNDRRGDVNPGNYNSIAERVLMWEYASYLMVVDPARMDAVFFETYGLNWSHPFSVTWLTAFERDIGLAVAKRSVLTRGTDGVGQEYAVFQREFEYALVLIRPQDGSKYGDPTAAEVTLPPGNWRMLRAEGSLGGPVSSVQLRNSEAVVLFKQ